MLTQATVLRAAMLATATWAPGQRDDRAILRRVRDKLAGQAGAAFAEQGIVLGDAGAYAFPKACDYDAAVSLSLEAQEIAALRRAVAVYFWPTLPLRFEDELLALDGWLKTLAEHAEITDTLKRVPRSQRESALANVEAEEALLAKVLTEDSDA